MIYLNCIHMLNWSDLSQTFQMPRTVCVCVFFFVFSGSLFVESHITKGRREKKKVRGVLNSLAQVSPVLTCGLRHLAQICYSLTNVKKPASAPTHSRTRSSSMDWARTPRGMFERYDARHHGSCLAQLVHEPGATHM